MSDGIRIRTPGLTPEEVAAVLSIVTATVEAQASVQEREPDDRRWARSIGPLAGVNRWGGFR